MDTDIPFLFCNHISTNFIAGEILRLKHILCFKKMILQLNWKKIWLWLLEILFWRQLLKERSLHASHLRAPIVLILLFSQCRTLKHQFGPILSCQLHLEKIYSLHRWHQSKWQNAREYVSIKRPTDGKSQFMVLTVETHQECRLEEVYHTPTEINLARCFP